MIRSISKFSAAGFCLLGLLTCSSYGLSGDRYDVRLSSRSFPVPHIGLATVPPRNTQLLRATRTHKVVITPVTPRESSVTAVSGESWLTHLNRALDETSMGKTGQWGPAPGKEDNAGLGSASGLTYASEVMSGADLYRLNCRGCHLASGQGAPPEINSVLNPVRASSAALVTQRMKSSGIDISRADAAQLAKQAKASLLLRLHQGGENMPPFSHLTEREIGSILAYLRQLAGVPGAERERIAVNESALRIGQHIVKSTCHTCHSAGGPNPTPKQMLEGAIPPLEALTTRVSQREFVRKVTRGAPVLMGAPPDLGRGRMPVFSYVTEEEAADVYLYLTLYPPTLPAQPELKVALSQQDATPGGGSPSTNIATAPPLLLAATPRQANSESGVWAVILLAGAYSFVMLLLAGGLSFTVWEFRRLSGKSTARRIRAEEIQKEESSERYVGAA
jgi:mono/diheme cytochrome c family protein